jgi:hypothetical protein
LKSAVEMHILRPELKAKNMRILIQNESLGLFWGASGAWVGKNRKLKEFRNAIEALRFCVDRNLKEVRLLFAFRQSSLNFFVAPFSKEHIPEFASRPDFRNSVLQMARNLAIQKENLELRRDLEAIIEERKVRRRKEIWDLHRLIRARKSKAA